MYAVKRTSIWGRVAARQHGAGTAKGVEAHLTVGRNEARYRSVTAKASRSEIGRSTGARVVCRLQKSVRSIFSSPARGKPRGKPRRRGVARRGRSFLDEGSFIASGDKGAGRVRANGHVNAESLHSVARPSIEPMEGVLGCWCRRAKPTAVAGS